MKVSCAGRCIPTPTSHRSQFHQLWVNWQSMRETGPRMDGRGVVRAATRWMSRFVWFCACVESSSWCWVQEALDACGARRNARPGGRPFKRLGRARLSKHTRLHSNSMQCVFFSTHHNKGSSVVAGGTERCKRARFTQTGVQQIGGACTLGAAEQATWAIGKLGP